MNYKPFKELGFYWPGFLLTTGNSVVRKQFCNLLCEVLVNHDLACEQALCLGKNSKEREGKKWARLSKSRLFFFLVGLFIPVRCEIHRLKILPLTS